jgi:protease-4
MDSRDIVQQLSDYRHNPQVRGVILRIDSPGGAVAPAQEIYSEILKLRANHKTVYASMGAVAASGGYYIACAADYVLANPGTLTGSISAVMALNNIEELTKKVGVKPNIIKSGKFKDLGSPLRAMTPEEHILLQGVVNDVHEQFVQAIARGRGLPLSEINRIADGRIMTGQQALKLNLIDEVGGLEKTIDLLAKKIGIVGKPKVIEQKEKIPFLGWLLQGRLSNRLAEAFIPSPQPRLQYLWFP